MAAVQMGLDRFGFLVVASSIGEPRGLLPTDRIARPKSSWLRLQSVALANVSASMLVPGHHRSQDLQPQELPQDVTSLVPKHLLALQAPQFGRS